MAELIAEFERVFRKRPEALASAPGIVNVIGEDSGHDTGLVLAVALEQRVRVAVARRPDRRVYLRSRGIGGESALALDKLERTWGWTDPVAAVLEMLEREGLRQGGFEMYVEGELPVGAGLASSAALELALVSALDALAGSRLSAPDRAQLCWQAENAFMGVGEALTPFLAAVATQPDHFVLVDCHDRSTRVLALEPTDYHLVLIDTGLRKTASQADAQRVRDECRQAFEAAQAARGDLERLRDLTEGELEAVDERARKRCRHIIGEAERVRNATDALDGGELGQLGRLLNESHASLASHLEIEPQELDGLTRLVQSAPGVLGARLARERNAGCVVALVHDAALEPLEQRTRKFYDQRYGRDSRLLTVGRPGAAITVELT